MDDGIQHPFETEIRDALEAAREGVDAGNAQRVGGSKALAGQEAKERGFAGPIGFREDGFVRMDSFSFPRNGVGGDKGGGVVSTAY